MNAKNPTLLRLLTAAALLAPLASSANDIEPGKEFYTAIKAPNPIVVDGDLGEWTGFAQLLNEPRFAIPKGSGDGGELVLFEEHSGGVWNGPEDQSSAVQVVYDDDNVYFGFVVTDDYHENSRNSPWNGDSIQLMVADDTRTNRVGLYNYALGGVEDALGNVIVMHEAGPGGTEAVITRDSETKETVYEIKLPKAALALDELKGGVQFGLGMAINDGDAEPGQDGQKGWGGLGAHALVFGKTPAETALVTLATANDIEPGKEFYFANPKPNDIELDGDLSDWAKVPLLKDPKFAIPKGTGSRSDGAVLTLFEEHSGGTYEGPDDQTSEVQMVYDEDNLYCSFIVTDDYHENSRNSAWNGDSIQLMIANDKQDARIGLYNYALGGVEGALGNVIVMHEAGPGGTEAVIVRNADTKQTIYEIRMPKEALGLDKLELGTMFGIGMAINDGDADPGQDGQKGWGGLGAHALVFGKSPEQTALVTLGIGFTGVLRTPPRGLPLDVSGSGGSLVFTWPSEDGLLYNLRSVTDLTTGDPITWPIFEGNQDIEATPPLNTVSVRRPGEASRYFVLERFPAPPESIYMEDFESGQGDWTFGSDGAEGTVWELGSPSLVGPAAANSPDNCWGTNLSADYAVDADIWLRSPPIDLTTAGAATVNFAQFLDIEEGFDKGRLAVLNAADNSELAVVDEAIDGVSSEWETYSESIPEEALGNTVILEWRFSSDDLQNFAGWYIDDINVTIP